MCAKILNALQKTVMALRQPRDSEPKTYPAARPLHDQVGT